MTVSGGCDYYIEVTISRNQSEALISNWLAVKNTIKNCQKDVQKNQKLFEVFTVGRVNKNTRLNQKDELTIGPSGPFNPGSPSLPGVP